MNRTTLLHVLAMFTLAFGLTQCSKKGDMSTGQAELTDQKSPPPAQREFRAAWVATVGNIDWPSKKGLSALEQQREAIAMLDKAREVGLNAIVFQIRTSADALYKSDLEPWSEFLTGEQGKDPGYDPLQFWINQSHQRGLELHAWFNPFRAMYGGGEKNHATRSKDHIWNTNREVVKEYGDKLWMDPGEPLAEKRSLDVFMDVVERYDVDGIHIDDYFYPYPITDPKTKEEVDFPDGASWKRYQESGGELSRNDWRRDNINRMMKKIYEGTKARKPHVRFGISPFGIWKPGYPEVIKGFDQHGKLYADAKLWLNEGWLDYWTPQLYWKLGAPAQPFEPLLHWWITENTHHRHIWPGLFTSKIGDGKTAWPMHDVLNQVWVTQDTPGASGHVHFSMKAITQNRDGIADALRDGPYRDPALVPAAPWLDDDAPPAPRDVKVTRENDLPVISTTQSDAPTTSPGRIYERTVLPTGAKVSWAPGGKGEKVWQWAVYSKHGKIWKLHVLPGDTKKIIIRDNPGYGYVSAVAIAAVDRTGNESKRVNAKLPKPAKK